MFIIPTNTCFGIWCFVQNIEWYKNIYELKWRDFNKPISIFVDSFEYLKKNTKLTEENINFLQNYDKPWTVVINIKNITDNELLQNISKLPNRGIYKKIAFRLAHTKLQKDLILQNWMFFLTSLNNSWEKEIIDLYKISWNIKQKIEQYNVEVLGKNINSQQEFSDIIEFQNDKIIFLRKKA